MKVLITAGVVKAPYRDNLYITKQVSYEYLGTLADALLSKGFDVTLFKAEDAAIKSAVSNQKEFFTYEEYRTYLLYHAREFDAIIMGAEVIEPVCQKSKPLDFNIQKEIKTLSPHTKIFGTFKANQTDSLDMIRDSAHKQALITKASAVLIIYPCSSRGFEIVLKEKSVLLSHADRWKGFVNNLTDLIQDKFYSTVIDSKAIIDPTEFIKFKKLIDMYKYSFVEDSSGYVFGTVAMRSEHGGFFTTGRGKREIDDITYVACVDDFELKVYSTPGKASLNAPLLNYLFGSWKDVEYIVHNHRLPKDLPEYAYAPPGSVRDSIRSYLIRTHFVVEAHGSYTLFVQDNKPI